MAKTNLDCLFAAILFMEINLSCVYFEVIAVQRGEASGTTMTLLMSNTRTVNSLQIVFGALGNIVIQTRKIG